MATSRAIMATKNQKKAKNSVNVYVREGEPVDESYARTLTKPAIQAAVTIQLWQGNITDVNEIAKELAKQVSEVNKGNLERPEAMLLAQAHTLDELFNNLARKAHKQTQLPQYETMLRLALKAQTQCRATLETLSNIKNPPVVYAKQANFASGHQQVNNGVPATRTGESKNQQNELLTELPNETLDTGRTEETITANPAMATVG
jgi:hypothetical protein